MREKEERGGETNGGRIALKVGGSASRVSVFEGSTLASREDSARTDARVYLGKVGENGVVVGGGEGGRRVGGSWGRIFVVGVAGEEGGMVLPGRVEGEYLCWRLHGEDETERRDRGS